MALFTRRERPPATALAALGGTERVLSWADVDDDGTVVIATPSGVWWPAPDAAAPRLIRWEHIDKAIWRDDVLTIIEANVVDDLLVVERRPVSLPLVRPRDLPPTLRKRVEANIVRTELVTVPGGAVLFVGRRLPGRDGVGWWARLEPGTRDTEQVRAAIRARLAILRSSSAPPQR
jgi:hypothetical protein